MVILPVHHRLERKNIPWMSLLIALLCIYIFAGPQQGDAAIEERAAQLYVEADLASIEKPLYDIYAASHPEALIHQLKESEEGALRSSSAPSSVEFRGASDDSLEASEDSASKSDGLYEIAVQWDRGFRRWLEAGQGFADAAAARDWLERSRAYRETSASTIGERFTMKSDTPTNFQALTATFLHGDWDHLIGNLVFLLMLGLLVERALGPWLFLGLYLLSGIAASWLWAVTEAFDTSLLGASGAIAGLMGALCVLWGMRRIRFFYWFIVLFDYVRAPAIWLLVPWLGWEVFQWATNDGSNVAYSAHAGGIMAGAALAAVVRWRGWDRADAYEETVGTTDRPEQRLANARSALGRLAFDEAEEALAPLMGNADASFEVRQLGLRIAMTARRTELAKTRAHALLAMPVRSDDQEQRLHALAAWLKSGGHWSPTEALMHACLLAARSRCEEAADILVQVARSEALPSDWPSGWLRLGFDRQRDGDSSGAKTLFAALVDALPESPEATKARSFASP